MNNMSWKTTLTACISAGGSFVLFAQSAGYVHFPPLLLGLVAFMQIGGMAGFGIVAKDFNVSGGQRGATGATGPQGPAGVDAPKP